MLPTVVRTPPRRSDSLTATQSLLLSVSDDLRDARRVRDHGQEEDLRLATDRLMNRMEELVSFFAFSILVMF
jgi:hypothetical protein